MHDSSRQPLLPPTIYTQKHRLEQLGFSFSWVGHCIANDSMPEGHDKVIMWLRQAHKGATEAQKHGTIIYNNRQQQWQHRGLNQSSNL